MHALIKNKNVPFAFFSLERSSGNFHHYNNLRASLYDPWFKFNKKHKVQQSWKESTWPRFQKTPFRTLRGRVYTLWYLRLPLSLSLSSSSYSMHRLLIFKTIEKKHGRRVTAAPYTFPALGNGRYVHRLFFAYFLFAFSFKLMKLYIDLSRTIKKNFFKYVFSIFRDFCITTFFRLLNSFIIYVIWINLEYNYKIVNCTLYIKELEEINNYAQTHTHVTHTDTHAHTKIHFCVAWYVHACLRVWHVYVSVHNYLKEFRFLICIFHFNI